jgi:hypothetical protein
MIEIRAAFWNLQNLFDMTESEIATDFGFTPAEGWTQATFDQKVANLAAVIGLMHGGQRPDLLGMCEIENKGVVETLRGALGWDDYAIAHDDSPDLRGIDTSLLYSTQTFEPAGEPAGYIVHLRYPTRDIFHVPLRVKATGAELDVLVNHWPSRSNGTYESEPFRMTVASHCGKLVDEMVRLPRDEFLALADAPTTLALLNERWNRNILLMGDFNDEPFNRSILDYLGASSGEDHLEGDIRPARGSHLPAANGYLRKMAPLFNCMWPILGRPDEGSYYFSAATNSMNVLDQFMISRGLYYGLRGLKMKLDSAEIFRPAVMTTPKGRPKKFEFNAAGVKTSGYSDHFPIQALIEVL